MQRPHPMTSRARILAALHGQHIDRIPFTPLIDPYTLVDMPSEITGGQPPGYDLPGLKALIAASRALGCDVMLRHVPVTKPVEGGAPHLESLGRFGPPVVAKGERKGNQYIETLTTPLGSLTGIWEFTDRVGWIPHPVRHAVNNYEELKIFHYAVDHLISQPPAAEYDLFLQVDSEIGDDGIATASIPPSPLMFLIEELCGLENTYYLLQDCHTEIEDILAKLHASDKRFAKVVAASPAQVVIQYEDTSTTLMSPAIFRRYCLPYFNEYAELMEDAGKIFLIHMCGKLRGLAADIGQGRFAGIADISPPPTGDLPLDEAAANLSGKVVVGGIDPTTFVCQDSEAVKVEVSDLIRRIKPFRGVLLGSADTMPRGTRIENLRLIRDLVDTLYDRFD